MAAALYFFLLGHCNLLPFRSNTTTTAAAAAAAAAAASFLSSILSILNYTFIIV
jgi:hypothetical protein